MKRHKRLEHDRSSPPSTNRSTIMEILCAVINFVVVVGFLGTLIWLGLIAIGAVLEGLECLAYKLWG